MQTWLSTLKRADLKSLLVFILTFTYCLKIFIIFIITIFFVPTSDLFSYIYYFFSKSFYLFVSFTGDLKPENSGAYIFVCFIVSLILFIYLFIYLLNFNVFEDTGKKNSSKQ